MNEISDYGMSFDEFQRLREHYAERKRHMEAAMLLPNPNNVFYDGPLVDFYSSQKASASQSIRKALSAPTQRPGYGAPCGPRPGDELQSVSGSATIKGNLRVADNSGSTILFDVMKERDEAWVELIIAREKIAALTAELQEVKSRTAERDASVLWARKRGR